MFRPIDVTVFQQRFFDAGATIIAEGEQGTFAYIVQSGRVEISRGRGAQRRLLGTIKPGGIFGEMALIDNGRRMADAVAVEDTLCLVIPPKVFREKLVNVDPFVRALLRILVHNVRSMADAKEGPEPRAADPAGEA
ncbi:MAG: cyclic nucleotide-binding domain-containing protein [Azospirillum sp.]|nr:cyclic nucleotide-binding domain-containing protein [Azospirillum sp.]